MIAFLSGCFAVALVVMTLAWWQQRRSGNATVVDAYWSLLVTAAGVLALLLGDGAIERRLVVGICLTLWGVRLAWHLWQRVLHDKEEDGRYADLRQELGDRFQIFLLLFLWFQALTIPAYAVAHVVTSQIEQAWSLAMAASVALFMLGWLIQFLADRDLAAFRRDPMTKGQVCRRGWWGRCRHPNYFGQWLMSISFAVVAIDHPVWWLAALAWLLPLTEWLLLTQMTGIPATEKRALRSRGEAYRAYQQDTPAFFPRLFSAAPSSVSNQSHRA